MALINNAGAASAIIGIFRLQLIVFIILCLYFGQYLLIPFALAILLTFILSPLVNKLEMYLGRILAVTLAFSLLLFIVGTIGYLLSKQLADLGTELPKYKVNIENKLSAFDLEQNNPLIIIFNSIDKLESHLPGQHSTTKNTSENAKSAPIKVVDSSTSFTVLAKNFIVALIDILGSTGLFFLLLLFTLFMRDDLRGRLIRLIGPTRISSTTLAMNDASKRVTHYLLTQLTINFFYGVAVAAGLVFIGVPNAILWGILGMVLRFIPYLGGLISAVFPTVIALAISPTWTMPILTILLFVILDLVTGNIIEPLLFSSKTGISSLALIISAVFWTLLWGPIGLLLSTPLTVCIIVLGLHVPKLAFLKVLLSDEKSLVLYEELYQSLIAYEFTEASLLMNNFVKGNSLLELYESTIIPMLRAAEFDRRNELLDEKQIDSFYQNIEILLDDVYAQSQLIKPEEKHIPLKNYSILCISGSTERDELVSNLLMHVLLDKSFRATQHLNNKMQLAQLFEWIEKGNFNAICISVIAPYIIIPAKNIIQKLHQKFPQIKIIILLLGTSEITPEIEDSLRNNGADAIALSLTQAVNQIEKFSLLNE